MVLNPSSYENMHNLSESHKYKTQSAYKSGIKIMCCRDKI